MGERSASERLAAMRNTATRYELAMTHPDGRRVLVAYTPRNNRHGLWAAITADVRRDDVIKLAGTDQVQFGKRAADGATMGAWSVKFTGRTQREAIGQGDELPYVGTVAGQMG